MQTSGHSSGDETQYGHDRELSCAVCGSTEPILCTAIPNCNSKPTCTTRTNQQCSKCKPNYYLKHGTIDSCVICPSGKYCDGTTKQADNAGGWDDHVCTALLVVSCQSVRAMLLTLLTSYTTEIVDGRNHSHATVQVVAQFSRAGGHCHAPKAQKNSTRDSLRMITTRTVAAVLTTCVCTLNRSGLQA